MDFKRNVRVVTDFIPPKILSTSRILDYMISFRVQRDGGLLSQR
jgi:hypothetical protein